MRTFQFLIISSIRNMSQHRAHYPHNPEKKNTNICFGTIVRGPHEDMERKKNFNLLRWIVPEMIRILLDFLNIFQRTVK